MSEEFLTISQLNGLIREVIDYGFPQSVWICGELQNFDRSKNKNNIFFELCEKDSKSNDIVAKMRAVIFARQKPHIEEILKNAPDSFELKDDIEVKFLCKVDFYPAYGTVQLIVESIDPVYTLGKLAQERQKVIALLKEKGVFEKNKEKELSPVPLQIGLISSDNSAAYNDFLDELKRSGYAFKIYFRNALMQGKGTEKDVCKALKGLSKHKSLDAIVITRGGGSIADLSYFDSQMIAEYIAQSPLPVLTGIGHEINLSIADMTAHTYAKTPTAIAQFLVERVLGFMQDVEDRYDQVAEAAQIRLEDCHNDLRSSALNLHRLTTHFLKFYRQELTRINSTLKKAPIQLLRDHKKNLEQKRISMKKDLKHFFFSENKRIYNLKKLIDFVDPANTLKRGFSIARTKTGNVIRNTDQISINDELETEVLDGIIHSQISAIKKEDRSGRN